MNYYDSNKSKVCIQVFPVNRINHPIVVAISFIFGISLLNGCKSEDPKLLTRLVQDIQTKVTRKLGNGTEDLPQDERTVVVCRQLFQGEAQVIEDFLAKEPKLSNKSLKLVHDYLDVSKRGFEFYDTFYQAGNFALTNGEKLEGQLYQDQAFNCFREVVHFAREEK